jgi:NAD+ kinase
MTDVLVVSKVTALNSRGEFFKERLARGGLTASQHDRLQVAHKEHSETLQKFIEALTSAGITYELISSVAPFSPRPEVKFVVAVGGDGTVLAAARSIGSQEVGLVGLRSSSLSVGYLCAYSVDRISNLVGEIRARTLQFQSVHRLAAVVTRAVPGSKSVLSEPVLNDFLYANASPANTSRYNLRINDAEELQLSSGIWLSTAVGSTAAILAAGGSRVPYHQRNFQYLVREPMHRPDYQLKLVQGFFDPELDHLSIENRCDQAILASDGGYAAIELEYGDVISFKRAAPLRLVIHP